MKLKLRSIVGASIGAFVLSIAAAGGANAISSSGTAYFDNGQPITANMWIQSLTAGTCASFSSSAVMNVSPNYITNNTKFYQIGVGGISVSGVSASQVGGDPANLTWTNRNGARGSYMSGNVCGGWGMLYLGADVSASAFYYGNYRVATAHV